jgi:predicted RNA-binding Zn-ribbon protein involved in translation (DUF1610 family)
MGFKDALKQSFSRYNPALVNFREDMEKEKLKRAPETEEVRKKKEELDEQGVAYCPKCGSISVQPMQKGFGLGKAVVGGALLGPLGLLAGVVGKNKVEMYCMKCGNKWKG